MFGLQLLRGVFDTSKRTASQFLVQFPRMTAKARACVHTSSCYQSDKDTKKEEEKKYGKYKFSADGSRKRPQHSEEDAKAITKMGHVFDEIPPELRSKETFHNAIGLFLQRSVNRRGQVEFIYAALNQLETFGLERDLDTYKALLNIFPKGQMIADNYLQVIMKHYPKHQDCCIVVLDYMQHHVCFPDKETYLIVENAFGKHSFTMRKMQRMMYWMPKFRHANPFRTPENPPKDPFELAKLAIQKMCRDPANEIFCWYAEAMENPPEKTWIVCGQSCHQRQLVAEHPEKKPFYVDGPYRVWVANSSISYFVLLADARADKWYGDFDPNEPETADEWANWTTKFNDEFPESRKAVMKAPNIHEQPEGTIMSIAVTGSSTKDSLVCWMHFLQRLNPKLEKIPVLFRLAHGISDLIVPDEAEKSTKDVITEAAR